jgi:hypothetical protein
MNKSGNIIYTFSGKHNVATERPGYYAFKVFCHLKKNLFERIGGVAAVHNTVELFYNKVLNDDRINYFFFQTDMTHQKKILK